MYDDTGAKPIDDDLDGTEIVELEEIR